MHPKACLVLSLCLLVVVVASMAQQQHGVFALRTLRSFRHGPVNTRMTPKPNVHNCTKHFHRQYVDHFNWRSDTFQQRYFVYDKWFNATVGGPIFFYNGNEDNVELYVNWTGLMWEHGQQLGALLVFAEHRFFGESLPCSGGFTECGDYLGTDQAMADFANLIAHLKQTQYPEATAVITFGGSYGGMLSAWMRMRYPSLVQGAIASSAPIGCIDPAYDGESYWAVVTRDATSAGGSAPNCSQNVNNAINAAFKMMGNASGREQLRSIFNLCDPLQEGDESAFGLFIQAAFDSMAMGDYPFPTYYISGKPGHPAPAWPMRIACQNLADTPSSDVELLRNLYKAISVVDNITGGAQPTCYNTSGLNPSVYSPSWDFMVCTEGMINEQPYFAAAGWPKDMFWQQPKYTQSMFNDHCFKTFGKMPRFGFLNRAYGPASVAASSNIVFANGLLDPWHSGGILTNLTDSIVALIIPEGGHHLDLFFSTPQDPPSVIQVRKAQVANMEKWISEYEHKVKKHSK